MVASVRGSNIAQGQGATSSVTLTGCTAGKVLHVLCAEYNETARSSANAVSTNETWEQNQNQTDAGNQKVRVYRAVCATSGSVTVTVANNSAASYWGIVIVEFNDADTTGTAYVSGAGGTGTGTSASTGATNPGATGDYYYLGFLSHDWDGSMTPTGTGFTQITELESPTNGQPMNLCYATGNGSKTATWSKSNSTIWLCTLSAYKAASTAIDLAGSSSGQTTAQAGLTTEVNLTGQASAVALTVGQLTVPIEFQGQSINSVLLQAGIDTSVVIQGHSINSVLSSAQLDTGAKALAGQIFNLVSTVSGLDTNTPILGLTLNEVLANAGLDTGLLLSGVSSDTVTSSADLTLSVRKSLWDTHPTPSTLAADPSSVTVGTQFFSDSDGYIESIVFYRDQADTNFTVGLFTSAGALLGSKSVSSVSAGWNTVSFDSPIAITASTNYVAAVFYSGGLYPSTASFFTVALDNAPLHAPSDNGTTVLNGRYTYDNVLGFPNASYQATCYFVDVVFLTNDLALDGNINGVVTSDAGLTTAIQNEGQASDTVTAQGDLSVSSNFSGQSGVEVLSNASLTTGITLIGNGFFVVVSQGDIPNTVDINVFWTASTDLGVTGYFVYWDTTAHDPGAVYTDYVNSFDVSGRTTESYTIAGLTPGQTCNINISSHGAGGHDAFESDLYGELTVVASYTIFDGSAIAETLTQGSLTTAIQGQGAAASVVSLQGAMTTAVPLIGTAPNAVLTLADITTQPAGLAGNTQLNVLSVGDFTALIRFSGASIAQALANAGLSTLTLLSGQGSSSVVSSGELSIAPSGLAGSATVAATAQASLKVGVQFSAQAVINALANAGLDIGNALQGQASTNSQAMGSLLTSSPISGLAVGVVSSVGGLSTITQFEGFSASVVGATGDLVLAWQMQGDAAVQVASGADLTVQTRFQGDAFIAALSQAYLTVNPIIITPVPGFTITDEKLDYTIVYH